MKKAKRKVNRSKRAKLNSHGFKTYKNTRLYIGQSTEGGWSRSGIPAPRKEIVDMFRNLWNNDTSIIAMRKHITEITITRVKTLPIAGTWDGKKKKITIKDNGHDTIQWYKGTVVHEIVGHAFWDFSRKWRRVELLKFNKLANETAPVNDYVKKGIKKGWKEWNDDLEEVDKFHKKYDDVDEYAIDQEQYQKDHDALQELLKVNGHEEMTRYANEQHSAITEIIYGNVIDKDQTLINDSDKEKLVKVWKELHY